MNENKNTYKITAIVCAFNEEKTIHGVMETVSTCPMIDEVLVVDDGSVDKTAEILSEFQNQQHVKTLRLPVNRGKGYGMTMAAAMATGELLLFLDADLIDLSNEHIAMMINTFINEKADMLLGSPVRGRTISFIERLDPFLNLTGQRVLYRKDFLQLSDIICTSGYGVETILNDYFREQEKCIHFMVLPYLTHPIKFEKAGLRKAIGEYLLEGKEILAIKWKKQQLFWQSVLFTAHRN